MKKIIFINSLTSGGAERVVFNLLKNNPDAFDLITIWNEDFYDVDNSLSVVTLVKKKRNLLFDLFCAAVGLYKHVRSRNIVAINSHLFWANYINILVSLLTKHKTICTHCVSFSSKFRKLSKLYYFHYFLCNILLRQASINTYKSQGMKSDYENLFNLKSGVVIYNPVNIDELKEKAKNKVDFIFENNIFYLLAVGRFHQTKKQADIILSLTNLPNNIHLILLGDGELKANCMELVDKLNLSERVHFLGNVTNPYPYYKNSDCYISSSVSEGFPNSLLEAMSLGCISICYDCYTGPREILSNYIDIYPKERLINGYDIYPSGVLFNDNKCLQKAIFDAFSYKITVDSYDTNVILSKLEPSKIYQTYLDLF